MTIAAERLAVIAAVTLPITALSSVMGMNVIVNDRSDPLFLTILLVIILMMSVALVWATAGAFHRGPPRDPRYRRRLTAAAGKTPPPTPAPPRSRC
jgi:hypothetical protein